MFIVEDPGKRQTIRDRELETAKAKAHAGACGQQKRRRIIFNQLKSKRAVALSKRTPLHHNEGADLTILPSPSTHPQLRFHTWEEGRSLQFFIQRTARECVGWSDAKFWGGIALQTSTHFDTVRHGLVSLGAFHESVATKDPIRRRNLGDFSHSECQKALACFPKDHNKMPYNALLYAHFILQTCLSGIHLSLGLASLRLCYNLIQQVRNQQTPDIPSLERNAITQFVEPILSRRQINDSQLLDTLWSLKHSKTESFVTGLPCIPLCFSSLLEARDCLEIILKWTTFTVKRDEYPVNTVPFATEEYLARWSAGLDVSCQTVRDSSEADRLTVSVLKISAKIWVMLIKIFKSEDETIFDQYTDVYHELADVFNQVCMFNQRESRTGWRLGAESSLICIVGNAATRWCRNPQIRRRLINLLHICGRQEGLESARTWSELAACAQELEERDISPPPVIAQDIPAAKRLRIDYCAFSPNWKFRQMHFLRPPYDSTNTFSIIAEQGGCHGWFSQQLEDSHLSIPQGVVIGRGYVSWPINDGAKSHYVNRSDEFYFNIPRI